MKSKIAATVCMLTLSACGGTSISLLPIGVSLTSPSLASAAPPPVTPTDVNFGQILNNLRVDIGVQTVTYNATLDVAAQAHAEDMVANNYFSHTSLDGRTTIDRIREAGYDANAYGENLAGRQQTDAVVLDDWINSPSHNAVLEGEPFEDFALGVAGQGDMTRWVLLLARERTPDTTTQ